jgi:hypothetical protein
MPKQVTHTSAGIPKLALSLVDLRAHFEAQLRTVIRAEAALLKCRTAGDRASFDASTNALRDDIQIMSDNNRGVRTVIDQLDTDARTLVFPATR